MLLRDDMPLQPQCSKLKCCERQIGITVRNRRHCSTIAVGFLFITIAPRAVAQRREMVMEPPRPSVFDQGWGPFSRGGKGTADE